MKKRVFWVIKIIVLILLVWGCNRFIRMAVYATDADNTGSRGIEKLDAFYKLKPDTLDVVFVGASHSNFSFIPMVISQENEVDCMDLGTHGLPIFAVPYYLEEICKTQHPKIAVVELYSLSCDVSNSDAKYDEIHRFSDGMRLSRNKYRMIQTLVKKENWTEHVFPIIANHASWKNKEFLMRVAHFFDPTYERNPYFGYEPATTSCCLIPDNPAIHPTDIIPDESFDIPDLHYGYLQQIVDICEREGMQLIFAIAPELYWDNGGNAVYPPALMAMADELGEFLKKNDIPMINYLTLTDEIGLLKSDSFDGPHMNTSGALKVSAHISSYLHAHYSDLLSSCSWDYQKASQSEWDDLMHMQAEAEKVNARRIKAYQLNFEAYPGNMAAYVKLLDDERYITLIAANNCANTYWINDIKDGFNALGLYPDINPGKQQAYAAIVDSGAGKALQISSTGTVTLTGDDAAFSDSPLPVDVSITSGADTYIQVNQKTYRLDQDGYLFVVYDTLLGETVSVTVFNIDGKKQHYSTFDESEAAFHNASKVVNMDISSDSIAVTGASRKATDNGIMIIPTEETACVTLPNADCGHFALRLNIDCVQQTVCEVDYGCGMYCVQLVTGKNEVYIEIDSGAPETPLALNFKENPRGLTIEDIAYAVITPK